MTGIVDSIPAIIDTVGQLIQSIITNIPTFLGALIDAAVQLFRGIVEAIPQVVPAVLDGIASLLQDVWDAITSFDLIGAGVDLVQGLIDGILSMGSAIIDAIGGVVGGAIDWAKSLLGIGSPSKLFRRFGDWTMQGLALGIEDGAGDALGAMRGVMTDLSDMSPKLTLDYATAGYAGAAYAVSAAPEQYGGPRRDTNIYIDGIGTSARVQSIVIELLDQLEMEARI